MTIATQIFASLVRARERAYASGRLGVARLPAPVISVGNLAVGGRGKTPTVIALGQALRRRGLGLDVLTRGYRRHTRALTVARTGHEDVTEVGDEPRLIARELGAPVLIHADRFRAGLQGEREFGSRLHLLDDGFQHRQLARAFDVVLLAASDLDDRLLPAGRLREPLSALGRASAVIWLGSEGASPDELGWVRQRLASESSAPVYAGWKRARPLTAPPPVRPLAFCGLARPDSFWRTLQELGIEPVARFDFPDHHRYRARELQHLLRQARDLGAGGFVTTAKDAMNLPPEASESLEGLQVIEVEMHIPDLDRLLDQALEACGL